MEPERIIAKPLVSVVIPTFNSEKTIEDCLKSIKNQTYRNIEIIIVDNYSQDKTIKIAKKYDVLIFSKKLGRSAARNFGAKKTMGDFLLFLDSDMVLTPKVIQECVEKIIKNKVDAIEIPESSIYTNFISKCKSLEKSFYYKDVNKYKMPRFFVKKNFLTVGGYDEKLNFGEDFDLARRYEKYGFKTGIIKSNIKHYENTTSLKCVILKSYQYGKSFFVFIIKNPSLNLKSYCPTRFLKNIKILLTHPVLFLGITFIKFLEWISFLIGAFLNINIKKLKH